MENIIFITHFNKFPCPNNQQTFLFVTNYFSVQDNPTRAFRCHTNANAQGIHEHFYQLISNNTKLRVDIIICAKCVQAGVKYSKSVARRDLPHLGRVMQIFVST